MIHEENILEYSDKDKIKELYSKLFFKLPI